MVNYIFPNCNFAEFILDSLQPGQTYQVRVACRDEKKSVGPFTDAIKVETPLRLLTPSNGGTEEVTTPPGDDGKAGNGAISLSSSTSLYGVMVSLLLGLMFIHRRQTC